MTLIIVIMHEYFLPFLLKVFMVSKSCILHGLFWIEVEWEGEGVK